LSHPGSEFEQTSVCWNLLHLQTEKVYLEKKFFHLKIPFHFFDLLSSLKWEKNQNN
jgi:hypothetical protein